MWCGGGGVVIGDGGAVEVEVWCGGGGVVIVDGGAVGIWKKVTVGK